MKGRCCWLRGSVGKREERREGCESVRVYVLVQGGGIVKGKKRRREGRLVVRKRKEKKRKKSVQDEKEEIQGVRTRK